jgi:hypothetical protein
MVEKKEKMQKELVTDLKNQIAFLKRRTSRLDAQATKHKDCLKEKDKRIQVMEERWSNIKTIVGISFLIFLTFIVSYSAIWVGLTHPDEWTGVTSWIGITVCVFIIVLLLTLLFIVIIDESFDWWEDLKFTFHVSTMVTTVIIIILLLINYMPIEIVEEGTNMTETIREHWFG